MKEASIIFNKAAEKASPVYETILENIKTATYVGSDETGAKVNGEKWWIWVWQNIENTFIKASPSRGYDTVEELFPQGLPNVTIGSDRWAAQLKITSKNKQFCFPHLQRHLIYLIELEKSNWATLPIAIGIKELLSQALKLRYIACQQNKAFDKKEDNVQQLEQQLNELLAFTISKDKTPKTFTFQKSMIKYRNYLFPCLYDLDVPPDNNASERAVRNIKVKQKISGQLKSGQHSFCVLRSIIDTLRKRELDVFFFLNKIMAN